MTEWIGAVDGGGTKTASALLSSDGALLTLPLAGGCNPQDNPHWDQELTLVMDGLVSSGHDFKAVTMGMPGFGEIDVFDAEVSKTIQQTLGEQAFTINDVEMAFHGAFPHGNGVLLLAGTGSMAVAKGPSGIIRVGGWGHLVGDEGSAYWIGYNALSLAARELDGRKPDSGFAAKLCATIENGLEADPFALVTWVSAQPHPRSALAGVARLVDILATDGEQIAVRILEQASDCLAEHVCAATKRAGLVADAPWATAGSVFRSDILHAATARRIGHPPVSAALSPLGGGLLLAARRANWPITPEFIETLARQLVPIRAQKKRS